MPVRVRTDERYKEILDAYELTLYSQALHDFVRRDRPMIRLHLPDKCILGNASTINRHWVLVFRVNETTSFPAK